jgi:hypothetical protein
LSIPEKLGRNVPPIFFPAIPSRFLDAAPQLAETTLTAPPFLASKALEDLIGKLLRLVPVKD